MHTRLTRSEVPEPLTWNLGHMFATEAEWEAALASVEREYSGVAQYQGRLGEGAGVLLACLTARDQLQERLSRVEAYASLKMSEEGSNSANQALGARVGAVEARVLAALSFIESEIVALPDGTVERYLQEEPGLAPYRHHLVAILKDKRTGFPRRPSRCSPR